MGDAQKKVSIADLAKLKQLIEQIPPYEPTHVSKQKAISMLAPAIDAMRAKGYRWDDIAAWLSERGLAVSSAAIRTYLRRIPVGASSKTRSQQRRGTVRCRCRKHFGSVFAERGSRSRSEMRPPREAAWSERRKELANLLAGEHRRLCLR